MDHPIQLWFAFSRDLVSMDVARVCEAVLSEDEKKRLQTLRFERHRREYLTTRALLRTALSRGTIITPDTWRFAENAYGKPAIVPDCGLRFNLSNCLELVVCAISNGHEVGVDLEPFERGAEIASIADTVFSRLECEQIEDLPQRDQADRALTLWTLKEAYVKARGKGLSLALRDFSFVFDVTGDIHLEIASHLEDKSERWRFCLLDLAQHRLALVTERKQSPALEFWELNLATGIAIRPAGSEERWYPKSQESL